VKRIMLVVALLLSVPAPALAGQQSGHTTHHDSGDCDWRGDCDDGWQGGGGNGNKGRDGDDQRGDKNCHSFCGNTIIVPTPPGMGGGGEQP
jgi:hypothetical protein